VFLKSSIRPSLSIFLEFSVSIGSALNFLQPNSFELNITCTILEKSFPFNFLIVKSALMSASYPLKLTPTETSRELVNDSISVTFVSLNKEFAVEISRYKLSSLHYLKGLGINA
jgi:hypothetical protein